MTEVNLARAREEGQDEAAWNAKNLCTRMTDNIPAFENWLQLLPNGDYGAVICGVFKLVVSVRSMSGIPQCLKLTSPVGDHKSE